MKSKDTTIPNKEIIQRLMVEAPRGRPLDHDLLQTMGADPKLVEALIRDGWLVRLSKGAFLLKGDEPTVDGTISYLSLRIPGLHVAGKSALDKHGIRHSIYFRERTVLWGQQQAYFPDWARKVLNLHYQKTALFDDAMPYEYGLKPLPGKDPNVLVSIPERALLEYCSDIDPLHFTEEAQNMMSSIRNLRADVLSKFISHCRQKKAVRIVKKVGLEAEYRWTKEVDDILRHGNVSTWWKGTSER